MICACGRMFMWIKGHNLFMQPGLFSNNTLRFWKDTSRIRYGIYCNNKWAFVGSPHFSTVLSMTYLELAPIVMGIMMFGSLMANSRIMFVSDNTGRSRFWQVIPLNVHKSGNVCAYWYITACFAQNISTPKKMS